MKDIEKIGYKFATVEQAEAMELLIQRFSEKPEELPDSLLFTAIRRLFDLYVNQPERFRVVINQTENDSWSAAMMLDLILKEYATMRHKAVVSNASASEHVVRARTIVQQSKKRGRIGNMVGALFQSDQQFHEEVLADLEALLVKRGELDDELAKMAAKLVQTRQEATQRDNQANNHLIEARQQSATMISEAQATAERILTEAQAQAVKITEQSRQSLFETSTKCQKLVEDAHRSASKIQEEALKKVQITEEQLAFLHAERAGLLDQNPELVANQSLANAESVRFLGTQSTVDFQVANWKRKHSETCHIISEQHGAQTSKGRTYDALWYTVITFVRLNESH